MIIDKFINCVKGKLIWQKLDNSNKSERYIIMPHNDDAYNYYALLYLEQFLLKKKINTATVVTSDKRIPKVLPLLCSFPVEIKLLTSTQLSQLMNFFALVDLSQKWTIVSCSIPYPTGAEYLLGKKGVTKKELVCFDIYGFSSIPKIDVPNYTDNDKQILSFLNLASK